MISSQRIYRVIPGLCCGVNEIFAPLQCYTAYVGSCSQIFQDNLYITTNQCHVTTLKSNAVYGVLFTDTKLTIKLITSILYSNKQPYPLCNTESGNIKYSL
jgi:hypothetical protein